MVQRTPFSESEDEKQQAADHSACKQQGVPGATQTCIMADPTTSLWLFRLTLVFVLNGFQSEVSDSVVFPGNLL